MTILNFGSCCIDNVYSVPHFARPGETLPCSSYEVHPGGKGLNQSIAIAASGVEVHHAGKVGNDGQWLIDLLKKRGVVTDELRVDEGPSGHANIQVTPDGENSIVLHGGSNQKITHDDVDTALRNDNYEFLLIQNEISSLDYLIEQAAARGMKIFFNAAPMTESVKSLPFELIDLLIINEVEGEALTGESEPDSILTKILGRFPKLNVVLTLGQDGARYADSEGSLSQSAIKVNAVDTTGAGDTFTGFFVAQYALGRPMTEVLELACRAAALSVTREGAASSIPTADEVAAKL